MDANFYSQFFPELTATICGGIVLAAFFFLLKEQVFSLPSISGVWECKQITAKSASKAYVGMTVVYHIVLLQEKEKILGDGEKDHEDGPNGVRSYSGKDRIHIDIKGRVEKFITKSDRIRIRWTEHGERRISSTIHDLRLSGSKKQGNLYGKFYSTAGKSGGTAIWRRIS